MKQLCRAGLIVLGLSVSPLLSAQISMELEEVCVGDVELTESVVQVIKNEAVSDNTISAAEIVQIQTLLASDEYSALTVSDKLEVVMTACAEGRILQDRNSYILNPE